MSKVKISRIDVNISIITTKKLNTVNFSNYFNYVQVNILDNGADSKYPLQTIYNKYHFIFKKHSHVIKKGIKSKSIFSIC